MAASTASLTMAAMPGPRWPEPYSPSLKTAVWTLSWPSYASSTTNVPSSASAPSSGPSSNASEDSTSKSLRRAHHTAGFYHVPIHDSLTISRFWNHSSYLQFVRSYIRFTYFSTIAFVENSFSKMPWLLHRITSRPFLSHSNA